MLQQLERRSNFFPRPMRLGFTLFQYIFIKISTCVYIQVSAIRWRQMCYENGNLFCVCVFAKCSFFLLVLCNDDGWCTWIFFDVNLNPIKIDSGTKLEENKKELLTGSKCWNEYWLNCLLQDVQQMSCQSIPSQIISYSSLPLALVFTLMHIANFIILLHFVYASQSHIHYSYSCIK